MTITLELTQKNVDLWDLEINGRPACRGFHSETILAAIHEAIQAQLADAESADEPDTDNFDYTEVV